MKNNFNLFIRANYSYSIRFKLLPIIILMLFFFSSITIAQNQNKKNTPLLKVTIKDGKITSTENLSPQKPPAEINKNRKIIEKTNVVIEDDASLNKSVDPQRENINKTTTGVDLEIYDAWIGVPRSPTISFNIRFRNNGTDIIPGGTFAIDAYLSTDYLFDAADYFAWGIFVGNDIQPGLPYIFSVEQEADVTGIPDGTYNLFFKMDATDVFAETDEDNNIRCAWNSNVTIGSFTNDYDFEITNIVLTQNTNPIDFEYTIRNNGTYASEPATSIFSYVYLSTDSRINSNDYFVASYNDNVPVFGGEFTRQVVGLNISGVPDNYYYLGVLTDADFSILETNERNNFNYTTPLISIETNNTDLYLFDLAVSDGEGPEISYNVRVLCQSNTGNVTANLSTYLSTDVEITTSDMLLNTWQNGTFIPGETNTFTINNYNVSAFPNGTYYLGAIVDPDNTVTEMYENNNMRVSNDPAITINNSTDNFDLFVSSLSISDAIGPEISFSFGVMNNGTSGMINSGSFTTKVYLSTDQIITISDNEIYSITNPYILTPVTIFAETPQITINNVPDGSYYLGVYCDVYDNIPETDEDNNISVLEVPQVSIINSQTDNFDLSVSGLEIYDTTGPDIQYHYEVLNIGSSGTIPANSFYLNEYLSDDLNITTSDYLINSWMNPFEMTPGYSWNASPTVTISGVPDGNYYLGIIVDPTEVVADVNRANNTIALSTPQIQVGGGTSDNFDLSVSSISVSDAIGPEIQCSFNCANTGSSGTIPINSFYTGIYLSEDLTVTESDFLIYSYLNEFQVQPAFSWSAVPTCTISGVPDGNYYLGVILDHTNAIADVNRANNTITLSTPQIQVIGGITDNFDLSVSSISVSDAVGPDIACSFDILNSGTNGTISANSFTTKVYLSADETVASTDFEIFSGLNPIEIPAGGTMVRNRNITINSVPDGVYFLGVSVDINNDITETNETNNTGLLQNPQIAVGNIQTDNFDLSVSAITISDSLLPEIHYDFTITNNGTAGTIPYEVFWIGEFLSADANITPEDFNIAEWLNPTDYPPGGAYYYNSIRYVTGIPDGQYYYGVILDLYNSIPETDEGNNSNYCGSPLIGNAPVEYCKNITLLNGWNILSIPFSLSDMTPASIFPDAISNAYGYNNGYVNASTFELGKGYWLKYPVPDTVIVCGNKSTSNISLSQGWNIISMYDNDYSVNDIITVPPGIITSSFYGYNNGYVSATTLESGKGYWVKANQAGTIVNPALNKTQTENNSAISINKEWSRIELTDASGRIGILYISENEFDLDKYELPPLPPDGIFDFRFTTDRLVEGLNSGTKEIRVSSADYPVTIKVIGTELRIADVFGGKILTEIVKSGESITISNSAIELLSIEKLTIPNDFTLYQNYPNPFNPVTKIKYSIPVDSKVRIAVYNLLGQEEKEILNQNVSAGNNEIEFDAGDLSSGVYFYSLTASSVDGKNNSRIVKRMLLMK